MTPNFPPNFLPVNFPWPGEEFTNNPIVLTVTAEERIADLVENLEDLQEAIHILERRLLNSEDKIAALQHLNHRVLEELGKTHEKVRDLEAQLAAERIKTDTRISNLEKHVTDITFGIATLKIE